MVRFQDQAKKDQLVTVAYLKYKMGLSQTDIAKKLDVSTMTISRLIEQAIDEKIVTISVHSPINEDMELSEELYKRFKLNSAFVVKPSQFDSPDIEVAKAAAFYLDMNIARGDVVGISGGRTLKGVMSYMTLPAVGRHSIEVVQLHGGLNITGDRNPTTALSNFTTRFGVKGYFIQQPMYVSSLQAASFVHEHYFSQYEKLWRKCTMLISAVGILNERCLQWEEDLISEEAKAELINTGAVGDIYGRWFDRDGRFVDCLANKLAISITPEIQRMIPQRTLITRGLEKIEAVDILIRMGLITNFITDYETAIALLSH